MKIKVLKFLPRFKIGDVIFVPDNGKGVPLSHYWRNRLEDAKTDGCCEIFDDSRSKAIAKPTKKKG